MMIIIGIAVCILLLIAIILIAKLRPCSEGFSMVTNQSEYKKTPFKQLKKVRFNV